MLSTTKSRLSADKAGLSAKTFLHTLFFFLLVTQICFAQWIQNNGLNDRKVPQHPLIVKNILREDGLLGLPTQDSMQAEFINRLDSLRASHMQSQLPDGKFILKGIKNGVCHLQKMLSPQSQIYVIDTAIVLGHDTTRHLYSFNANAKRTSDLTQTLTGGLWVDTQRDSYTYDASNNMLTEFYEYWENGQWVNSYRGTCTYDAQGNRLSELYEDWQNGQWVNSYRGTYTYDAQGNMLTELYENWQNGQWVNSYRGTYTNDAQGNMLTELYENWQNGQWVNSGRSTYTYDAQGNRLTTLYENWENGQWVNVDRSTYTYDAQGNGLTMFEEVWLNGQWVNWWRWTLTYDAQGNRLSELYEDWQNGQWVNSGRVTYTYDEQGNMLTYLYELWENGQWVNYWRPIYTYDGYGNVTSFFSYGWFNSAWVLTVCKVFAVTDNAGNDYRYMWIYGCTLTRGLIITDVASQSGSLPASYSLSQNWPNPFNPSTKIKYQIPASLNPSKGGTLITLKVYDVLGNEIETLVNEEKPAGTYEITWYAENLPSGVYFYQLRVYPANGGAGSFIETKKMLLLK